MDIAITLLGFLIPVLVVIFGLWLTKKTPQNRMGMFGYRTERSRRSRAAWEFANKLAGKYWLIEGLLLLPISALALWLLHKSLGEEAYLISVTVLLIAQTIFICIPLPLVERALKDKFGN